MESDIVRVNFKEKKKQSERAVTPESGVYAEEASEVARQYLAVLEGSGERPDTVEALCENATERTNGQCPHCGYVCEVRFEPWVVINTPLLRVRRDCNRCQILCRRCRRWINYPSQLRSATRR